MKGGKLWSIPAAKYQNTLRSGDESRDEVEGVNGVRAYRKAQQSQGPNPEHDKDRGVEDTKRILASGSMIISLVSME